MTKLNGLLVVLVASSVQIGLGAMAFGDTGDTWRQDGGSVTDRGPDGTGRRCYEYYTGSGTMQSDLFNLNNNTGSVTANLRGVPFDASVTFRNTPVFFSAPVPGTNNVGTWVGPNAQINFCVSEFQIQATFPGTLRFNPQTGQAIEETPCYVDPDQDKCQ